LAISAPSDEAADLGSRGARVGSVAPAPSTPRPLGSILTKIEAHIRALLIGYGILMALVGIFVYARTPTDSIELMGARQEAIQKSISVLNHGGPPLLSSVGGVPVPAEAGDDPGMILYLSVLGHATGTTDSLLLLKWFFISAFALLLAAYPVIWFELLSSLSAALISPILVLLQFRFLAIQDIYWVSAWCVLFCLPLLMVVYRRWGRSSLALLSGVMLIASLASSVRSQAGLPIFFSAVIVVFLRVRPWISRMIVVAVLAVAYTAVSGSALNAVRHYRDTSAGVDLSHKYTNSHTLWHSAYIGLGFVPNKYGIKYNDSVAIDAVKRKNSSAVYLSREYERAIRSIYFDFVRRHPWFAIQGYLRKATVVVADGFRRFWFVVLLLPAMMFATRSVRKEMRGFLWLLLPCFLFGLIPPVLAGPILQYETQWLGGWGVLWLFTILWFATLIPWVDVGATSHNWGSAALRSARFRTGLPLAKPARTAARKTLSRLAVSLTENKRAAGWSFAILVGVSAFAIALNRVAESVRAESAYQFSRTQELARVPIQHGPAVQSWAFGHRPAGWSSTAARAWTRRGAHADVLTNDQSFGYQIISPVLKLGPGAYALLVHGEVLEGGLALEVLDVSMNRFVVEDLYSAEQRQSRTNFQNGRMFTKFSLASTTQIQLVLSNWAPKSRASRWRLQSASLVRQKRPCGCSPPDSDAWISK